MSSALLAVLGGEMNGSDVVGKAFRRADDHFPAFAARILLVVVDAEDVRLRSGLQNVRPVYLRGRE